MSAPTATTSGLPQPDAVPAHQARREQVRGVLLGDLIATGYAIGVGIGLRYDRLFRGQDLVGDGIGSQAIAVGIGLWIIWNIALWTQGTRAFDVVGSGAREYWEVTRITGVVFAYVVTISYIFKLEVARGFVLFAFPVGLLLTLSWRFISNRNVRRAENVGRYAPRAVVLARAGDGFDDVLLELRQQFPSVIACESLPVDMSNTMFDDVRQAVLQHDADFVIAGPGLAAAPGFLRNLAWALNGFETRILMATSIMRRSEPQIELTTMWGERVVLVDDIRLSAAQRFKKRTLDLVLTIMALPLWLPLVALLAILVKCTSRGPAFYSHMRIGQDGQEFRMWKLRTMVRDAEAQLQDLLDHNEADGPLFKMANDPRVTRLGRFLRRTSLDETPQLFQVLRGHMSLVGPRPQLPREVLQYTGQEHRRLVAKPGCTGLWQISGTSKLDWDETISLDLEYIHNWTLWLDLWVLLKTVPEVLLARGQ